MTKHRRFCKNRSESQPLRRHDMVTSCRALPGGRFYPLDPARSTTAFGADLPDQRRPPERSGCPESDIRDHAVEPPGWVHYGHLFSKTVPWCAAGLNKSLTRKRVWEIDRLPVAAGERE